MKYIVSFSGGKDSTAMLLLMIEKNMVIDKIINVDTTKEYPEMYDHIEKVKKYIYPLKIITVKIDFDYWFGEHVKTRGKNKGKVGYGWCDFKNRWCTALKHEAISKTMKSQNYNPRERGVGKSNNVDIVEYHGIAFDEIKRTKIKDRRNIKYPLVEWNMTEKEALKYCYSKGFDWDGLYEITPRVSCYVCPMQRIGMLRYLYNQRPKLWAEMIKMDKKSFRKYRPDYSLKELETKFNKENNIK